VARTLSQEEKLRYPWASRITDYVPVGRWRRYGLLSAVTGICILGLGVLVIYVMGLHVHMRGGVPRGVDEWLVVALSTALMAAGFFVGMVTTITAGMNHARAALFWSTSAMLPGLLWLVIWLTIR
jgi:hypothetical protein